MARGIQPSVQQLEEERHVTLLAATDARLSWDEYERQLLVYLEHRLEDPNVLAVARRLLRGDVLEDIDHRELHEAVRQVSA